MNSIFKKKEKKKEKKLEKKTQKKPNEFENILMKEKGSSGKFQFI